MMEFLKRRDSWDWVLISVFLIALCIFVLFSIFMVVVVVAHFTLF